MAWRMFLLEGGKSVTITDAVGNRVAYPSIAAFNAKYPALDITGKNYILYQPDHPEHAEYRDDVAAVKQFIPSPTSQQRSDMRVIGYESCIDETANLADPYFGMSLVEAKAYKKSLLLIEGKQHFEATWDIFTKQVRRALSVLKTVTAVYLENPCRIITEENTEWHNNWPVFIPQIEGTVELQGFVGKITVVGPKEITLNNVDATGFTPYTGNGYLQGEPNYLQMKIDYEAVEDHYQSKRAEVDACGDVACVKAVSASWPALS